MNSRGWKLNFRTFFWPAVAIVLAVLLVLAFRPRPVLVDLAGVSQGPLTVAVRDEARTRVRDIYVVSAPVAGRLLRVGNRAGERIEAGAVIALIQPAPPTLVDERSRRELQAAIRAAEAGGALARAELDRAEAQLAHARLEAERVETLFAATVASRSALDRARLELRTAVAARDNARAGVDLREANTQAARARLADPASPGEAGRTIVVRAPAGGRILRVLQESESVVAQGAPLVELGDAEDLEIVAELLSSDAARIRAGAPVLVEAWGDGAPIRGRVRQVEPFGFRKVSALGVEEQRVNVIIDPVAPPAAWTAVGHGYRVEVAVTVWSSGSTVRAPVAALFRLRGRWAVFRIEKGRARLQLVEIGQDNGDLAEIRSGLRAGERVVLHPNASLADGARVRPRPDDR